VYGFWQLISHWKQANKALPGPGYLTVLRWMHQILRPATYVEIGVRWGHSLHAASPATRCIGIDPQPRLKRRIRPNTRIFPMTSDAFFESHNLAEVLETAQFSLAFIDGLHLFDQAYADFMHLERFAGPRSVIMLHDCLPLDRVTSERTRTTDFYSGDVWKLARCLKEQRPDLKMITVRTAPTGLCLVTNLNHQPEALQQRREEHLARYSALDFDDYRKEPHRMPDTIESNFAAVQAWLEK
jgi:predicted O-methyltransferase YrrM